jgi:hypothetical protein
MLPIPVPKYPGMCQETGWLSMSQCRGHQVHHPRRSRCRSCNGCLREGGGGVYTSRSADALILNMTHLPSVVGDSLIYICMASECRTLSAVSKTEPLTLARFQYARRIPIVIQESSPSYSTPYPRRKNYTCFDFWETITIACNLHNEHYHPP